MSTPTFDESKADKSAKPARKTEPTAVATQAPSVAQVDRMIAAPAAAPAQPARSLVVPDVVDLGDCLVGEWNNDQRQIAFNLEHLSAAVSFRLEGDPDMHLMNQQDLTSLPPKAESHAGKELHFRFQPKREGYMTSTLVVNASWPGKPGESYRIPVRAAARNRGSSTLAEREDATRKQDQQRKEQEADKQIEERVDRDIAEERKRPDAPHHGAGTAFNAEAKLLGDAVAGVYEEQKNGVENIAMVEIGDFKRKLPAQETNLVRSIAWAALDFALDKVTLGISTAVSTAVKKSGVSGAEVVSKLVDKALTAGLKKGKAATMDAVKAPYTPGKPAPATAPAASKGSDVSHDPKGGFASAQVSALNHSKHFSAPVATERLIASLRPQLRTDPEAAIKKLTVMREEVANAAGTAKGIQAQKSVEEWLRLVAQSSIGREGTTENSRVDADAAAESFGEKRPLASRDGLLDIRFAAQQPTDPVQVQSSQLFGVRKAVVQRIQTTADLTKAHIPIRASTNFGGVDYSVSVVRDEAGKIAYDENTQGAAPSPSPQNWLGQRAGRKGTAQEGAEQLMKELLAQRLPAIKSDSED